MVGWPKQALIAGQKGGRTAHFRRAGLEALIARPRVFFAQMVRPVAQHRHLEIKRLPEKTTSLTQVARLGGRGDGGAHVRAEHGGIRTRLNV